MPLVAHGDLISRLMGVLPPVSLFVGPPSVGKWTAAEHLRGLHEIRSGDLMRSRALTADEARSIVHFAQTAPLGAQRLVIARLDGARPASLNALLKSLEESTSTRFILIATELPPATITSRAEVIRFPLLTDEQVEDVLMQRGFKPTEAKRYAALGKGQVKRALAFMDGNDAKVLVLAAVRAIRERDERSLDQLTNRWADEHTDLLAVLCREVITGRWRTFQHAEVEGMQTRLALQLLFALRADIRPRLVVHASLTSILKEYAA